MDGIQFYVRDVEQFRKVAGKGRLAGHLGGPTTEMRCGRVILLRSLWRLRVLFYRFLVEVTYLLEFFF